MRRLGRHYFGEGVAPSDAAVADAGPASGDYSDPYAWNPNWNQPTPTTGATVRTPAGMVPQLLADPSQVDINPDGTPTYLAAPGLPSWVLPVAIGAGAFLLLGGGALIWGVSRRKRRR
jgi:hypothetical protein